MMPKGRRWDAPSYQENIIAYGLEPEVPGPDVNRAYQTFTGPLFVAQPPGVVEMVSPGGFAEVPDDVPITDGREAGR
ncbi:MAG: hypothetical protein ACE149_17780 [Armatimonadota bacterium]